jgi:folate-binding Fe-S cluster repair protein YgfZ
VSLVGGGNYDSSIYCRCKGQINSDFFVKCDGDDECFNGGWLHPQCTTDLHEMKKEEVDLIE